MVCIVLYVFSMSPSLYSVHSLQERQDIKKVFFLDKWQVTSDLWLLLTPAELPYQLISTYVTAVF